MKNEKHSLVTIAYLGTFMILFAAIVSMFSTILPKITDLYTLSMSQISTFTIATNYVATFIGTFFLISLGDRFPKGLVVGLDAILMGILLLFINSLPAYLLLTIAFSALHLTTGILNNMITAFVADMYGAKRSRYISMMHIFYSIGALFGPKLPELVENAGFHWNNAYALMAIIVLVVAFTYLFVIKCNGLISYKLSAAPAQKTGQKKSSVSIASIVRHPMFIPLCLLQMFYMSGHQTLFGNWFQLFLQKTYPAVYTASFTATCMTIYWFGMLGSRLLSMVLAEKVTPRQFITIGSAVGVCAQLLGIFGNQPVIWMVACFVLGLCTGGIYPLTFSISIAYFPEKSAGITSLISIISTFGGIVLTYVMGQLANVSMFASMFLPILSLAIVFVLIRVCFKEK